MMNKILGYIDDTLLAIRGGEGSTISSTKSVKFNVDPWLGRIQIVGTFNLDKEESIKKCPMG